MIKPKLAAVTPFNDEIQSSLLGTVEKISDMVDGGDVKVLIGVIVHRSGDVTRFSSGHYSQIEALGAAGLLRLSIENEDL